jgi:hypothetical protein
VSVPVGTEVVSVLFGGAVLLGTTVLLLHDADPVDGDKLPVPVPVPVGAEAVSVLFGGAVLLGKTVLLLQDDEPDGKGIAPVLLTEEETVLF